MDRFGMKRVLCFAVLAAVLCGSVSAQSAPGWVTWRGPNGNGTIRSEKFDPSFPSKNKILWKVNVGAGFSSLAVTEKFIYTMGGGRSKDGKDTENVLCLDRKNGKTVWTTVLPLKRTYEYDGPRAMPVIDGENLYVLGLAGDLYCLALKNGKQKWHRSVIDEGSRSAQWGFSSAPVIEGNMVVVNVGEAGMAFNKTNGKPVWKTGDMPNGYATPVIFDWQGKRLGVMFGTVSLSLVDVSNGTVLSSYPWVTGYNVNASDPVVLLPEGKLIVSSAYYKGSALLDFSSGKFSEVRSQREMQSHFSSHIARDGFLYGVDGSANESYAAKISCMNIATGEIAWSQRLGEYGSIMIVNDTIVLLTENGKLITAKLDSKAYSEIAMMKVFEGRAIAWPAPVFWDGFLYLRSNAGDVVCVDAK